MNNFENMEIKSGSTDLDEKIKQWLKWDTNDKTREEVVKLIKEESWTELKKRMLTRLSFGTAGLRGVMQAGFNSMNELVVIQSAQGFLAYVLECFPDKEDQKCGIVVGFDGRFNSKTFAELTTLVFINAGIPVWLFSTTVATPYIPFTIVEKKCLAGVMVTASHNPKEDNGYKVYWRNGAQIIPPHDKNIEKYILNNLEPKISSNDLPTLNELRGRLVHDPNEEMRQLYIEKLLKSIPSDLLSGSNENSPVKIAYSAMHGVGYPFIQETFAAAKLHPVNPVIEQCEPNPEFPTVKFPNPEEVSSLKLSLELADKCGCDLILANDPDADRLACAERNKSTGEWKIFTGNELGGLLGWWSMYCHKATNGNLTENCYMLSSTVSSMILRSMAKQEGFQFIDTLTGFKWMGNTSADLLKNDEKKVILFAYEEAIGFMCSSTVLDKDGISAACHLATLSCYLNKFENLTLSEKLIEIYKTYGYHFTINSYFICHETKIINDIFDRIRNFSNGTYPTEIKNGKYRIKSIRDLTTGLDTSQPDEKAILPISKSSNMITFTFDNGVVLTLRTSGTEPKIKYYSEMCAKPEMTDWEELREILKDLVNAFVVEMLRPTHNKLIPQDD